MGTISEKSATQNERQHGIGVDTATCFVGTTAGYTQASMAFDLITTDLDDSVEGLCCMTGWGDGYYPIYLGAHLLDPAAVAFVEFLPPVVITTHTDIDGDIHWNDVIYTADQAQVEREKLVHAPDGKILIAGDPFRCGCDIETIAVEPGSYTIRVYSAASDDIEGRTVCVIIAPAA